MQLVQITSSVAQVYGISKKAEKKPFPAIMPETSVPQEAYRLDVQTAHLSRLDQVRSKIASGYYNDPQVISALAENLVKFM